MKTQGQVLSKNSPVRFLALGDSYTIGESVAEVQRWPVQLVDVLSKAGYRAEPPEIVAVTGWRTDDLKKALNERKLPRNYDLVSLLIGVNNQYQGRSIAAYEIEFEDLLEIAIAYAGGVKSKVFVLSIPDYGFTPFGREKQTKISEQIDMFNNVNRSIARSKGITYIDITDISRLGLEDPDLLATDGLHPSVKMYALWVQRIQNALGL
jgi:lysophospholipase L1-like esterase